MLKKTALLSQIIKQYLCSAAPVGSKLLAQKSSFAVSSATIRNNMAWLEKEGYIVQPHTSAGRVPTEKGYCLYLEDLVTSFELAEQKKKLLKSYLGKINSQAMEPQIKKLAQMIAEMSHNAVVVGFSADNVYYTGIANLFAQPEFSDQNCVYNLSLVIDHLDKVMEEIFTEIRKVEIKIGSQNPFGNNCSVILTPWQIKKKKGILGILGPMRMDYENNLGIINFVNQNIV
ncbi:hypothetical protein KKF32_02900 [Patescibacteria group bacterium]|nr:hypothetical protein [Patescibacteria group bacterium]